jgi:hypothetical protein
MEDPIAQVSQVLYHIRIFRQTNKELPTSHHGIKGHAHMQPCLRL